MHALRGSAVARRAVQAMSAEPGELPEEVKPSSVAAPANQVETSGPPTRHRSSGDSSASKRNGSSGKKVERGRSHTKQEGGTGVLPQNSSEKDAK